MSEQQTQGGATRMVESQADPWEVQETDFLGEGSAEDQLRFLVSYAVLAPSSHNTQPWIFNVREESIDVYADRTRALPVVDPEDRELTISCGAAIFHLGVAMRRFGRRGDMALLPDPVDEDLLASVSLGDAKQPTPEDLSLFEAIPRRRTNRKGFEPRPVPPELLRSLQDAVALEGAWLHVVEDEEGRRALADLIADGDRIQWGDPRFRRELAAWMHPRRKGDGLASDPIGLTPLIVRTFDIGKGRAAKDRELASGSPVLAVLGTDEDDVHARLGAGQALGRILLQATAGGVSASFLNQPIEVEELRPRLQHAISRSGFPQILLRLGFGPEISPSARRPVVDVVEADS